MDPNLVLTISMPPSLMYVTQLHTYLESYLFLVTKTPCCILQHFSQKQLVSADRNRIWNANGHNNIII